jgi:hypothetical protein
MMISAPFVILGAFAFFVVRAIRRVERQRQQQMQT